MAWKPGQSGNPGGRPKENAEVKALAREHGKTAIAKLVALLDCGTPAVERAAAVDLLDRGYGKPTQTIAGDDDLGPVSVAIVERRVIKGEEKP